jgi:membrane-associated protease RseP (regulator of RpoE activity)
VKGRVEALFLAATVLTTLLAGSLTAGGDPFSEPFGLLRGLPFAISLLSILGVHELAHYFTSRRKGVRASLPLFLPGFWPFGTFGALIRIKSPIPNRRALLDIGASGPLAGFAAALPVAVVGLFLSSFEPIVPSAEPGLAFGSPLVFTLLEKAVLGARPEGYGLLLHPVAFAAWIGFFVTALNLLPVGQLDGGHILYALFGRGHHRWARVVLFLLLPLGFFWPGWLFWGALMCFMGYGHPPVLAEGEPLEGRRKVVAVLAALVLVLTFTPVPVIV